MAREHLLKIGVSGIRGVVGEFLTPSLACAFAQAFGTYVGGGRVVVGRDTRSSGPMLQHAVDCGLLAAGCEVVDVGQSCRRPPSRCTSRPPARAAGIALTASHNPPEYNALKLFNSRRPVLQQLRARRAARPLSPERFPPGHQRRNPRRDARTATRAQRLHIDRVLRARRTRMRSARRKFRVALDAVNGAGLAA